MKKRLLITSIVMMLVVAVALSTATYAWFTSNANVQATAVTFTAATNTEDSIAIAWTGNDNPGTILTAGTAGTSMRPMVPETLTDHETTSAVVFKTGKLYTSAGVPTFKDVTSTDVAAVIWATNDNGAASPVAADSFYIKNNSTANVVTNIKVTATITPNYIACTNGELAAAGYTYYSRTGTGTDQDPYVYTQETVTAGTTVVSDFFKTCASTVRVAVFTRDLTELGTTDTSSNFLLRGVFASTASADTYLATAQFANDLSQTTYASTAANKRSGTVTAADGSASFNLCYDGGTAHTLKAQGIVEVKVLVWMDGEALTDNTQGAAADVALGFAAVNA